MLMNLTHGLYGTCITKHNFIRMYEHVYLDEEMMNLNCLNPFINSRVMALCIIVLKYHVGQYNTIMFQ